MKKPSALIQLLDDLESETLDSSVVTLEDSWMKVYLAEDAEGILLNPRQCELLLDTPQTVRQLHEALDEPEDCAIELHSVVLEQAVEDALERYFAAVDEV